MGLDASEVGRDPDAERLLRSSYSRSMNHEVRRLQKMLRNIEIDPMLASFQGSIVPAIGDVRAAEMISNVVPESMRRDLLGLSGTLRGLSNYPRMPSDVLKQARMLASVGLSSSIAQAFNAHGLDSANLAAWILRSVQPVRTPALQSVLKSATTF